jgi:hypothetical protein
MIKGVMCSAIQTLSGYAILGAPTTSAPLAYSEQKNA